MSSRSGVFESSRASSSQDGSRAGTRSKDIVECFIVDSTESREFSRDDGQGRVGSQGSDGIFRRCLWGTTDIEADMIRNVIIISRMGIRWCRSWRKVRVRGNAIGRCSTGMARSTRFSIVLIERGRCSARLSVALSSGLLFAVARVGRRGV